MDLTKRLISFDNPDQFDPDETVYIYFVDLSSQNFYMDLISFDNDNPENLFCRHLDDRWQIAVTEDEIIPDKIETYKSGDLLKYYRLVDKWD